ncbi:hypothetical protein ELI03_36065 [Rhizobium leguminosarum]|uniref:Uncharacterized protein n=1 Tax=Rhizobium leguminosarum TaxID=384 RepID=A0A4Q8XVB8_RHILE|nr:hypothetical protein ELI03_36065 [Rhizobium leguminosarum]
MSVYRFDLVSDQSAAEYPGHIICVSGDRDRTTGTLTPYGQMPESSEQALEAAIYRALLFRQRDARPIGIRDNGRLWPLRLGAVVHWEPPKGV